ncbi:hexose transporter [Pyrenophora seminiperda CCB06]|uniref:Hexose transporter n=1 Tax=Pyrenophora seminiperda CCB06 TaxID=1302712 RepID=A0A3M7M7R5_9PLEO|nr:hexose transporter [Pyrenophora seminiperda CCB06]
MPEIDVVNKTHPQWWRDPGIRKLNFLLLTCYLGAISNGYVSSLISSLIANQRWFQDISGLSSATRLGLVVAAQSIGSLAAFFPAPWLSDKFGRRIGILFGNLVMTVSFIGQMFTRSSSVYLAMRLTEGFGAILNIISSSALCLELAHPRQRAVVGAFFNTFYFFGAIASTWTSYGSLSIRSSWSWRFPVAIQLSWTVFQLVLLFFCPESPRWLVSHGNHERARSVLATYHANGHADDDLASFEPENCSRQAGWGSLFTTPGNRKRLTLTIVIAIATQWVGNGIIIFYLPPVLRTVGITSVFQQQGINGGLQIYNWFIACGAALLAERVGRRRLFLTSAATMLLFMVLITVCSARYSSTQSVAAGYAVIVFLFLFLGGYVIGLTPIPVLYINEIWPSYLRAKGASIFFVTQALAVCFNQYVNPIALESIMWRYYLVYVGVLIVVAVFMFFCVPETKGLSLEEVRVLFDRQQGDAVAMQGVTTRENAVVLHISNMDNHKHILSPLPDIVRAPSAPPHPTYRPSAPPYPSHRRPSPPTYPTHRRPSPPLPEPFPDFLIIGLFALRLTRRLIGKLDYYPERTADVTWLTNFLAPFDPTYELAKVSGPRKDDYVRTYQSIIRRMKRQPKYPMHFMQMNPDPCTQRRRDGEVEAANMRISDDMLAERLDIINFCDAAGEWGSIVPIPAHEADRMLELADRRRVADLDGGQERVEELLNEGHHSHGQRSPRQLPRQPRFGDVYPLPDIRQPQRGDGGYPDPGEDRSPPPAMRRRHRVSFVDDERRDRFEELDR